MADATPLKIVHLVASDVGGAYRAADRISRALRLCGADSNVTVLEKKRSGSDVRPYFNDPARLFAFKAVRKLYALGLRKWRLAGLVYRSTQGVDIGRLPGVAEADVINLHWINDGMVSYRGLAALCACGKPVVWTMHDMFCFTAGCYYDDMCGGFREECRRCPHGVSAPGQAYFDKMYTQKQLAYRGNISFVGCSRWIADCARESSLCKGHTVARIPNPIDLDVFCPMDKTEACARLGLQADGKKNILFGAMHATSDRRKGYPLLLEALRSLSGKERYRLLVFGGTPDYQMDVDMECINLGCIDDDGLLCAAYSAADVFVAPSRQENLSNAVMEALACGTPVAAFRIGGMADLIAHEVTGYLAEAFEPGSLAKGIEWCSDNDCGSACRTGTERQFGMQQVGEAYLEFYRQRLAEVRDGGSD